MPKETRICLVCGESFLFRNSPSRNASGRGKYCSRSCGNSNTSLRHGHAAGSKLESPTYISYYAMRARCCNPNSPKYPAYGAIGITVCDQWINSFKNFLLDMGDRPHGTSIDRIDGSGPYSKENCRWATITEQQRNIKSNRNILFNGKTQCLSAWSQETGLSECVISYRIKANWPIDKVMTIPAKFGNRISSK